MAISSDIRLTAEQQESVNYDAGDLLIRGVAGSGKSVVLMSRALSLNKKANDKGDKIRILILTYTKALVKYTSRLVSLSKINPCLIELNGIDSLIFHCCQSMKMGRIDIANDAECAKYAALALNQHLNEHQANRHRFYDVDPQFWADEFIWMKQKDLRTADAYEEAERTGRGNKVRIARTERSMVFEFFQNYEEILKKNKKINWEDLYLYAWDHRDTIPYSYLYDFVLIDEAQDLSFVQLRFAKYITRKAITIAADNGQKIYNKSFSWRDLGIDLRGRASKKLSVTFRNTKEIWAMSECLQNVNRYYRDDNTEYTDSEMPDISGLKPRVYRCLNGADEDQAIVQLAKQWIKSRKVVGILYRSYNPEGKAVLALLKKAGIPFEFIGGKSEWDITEPGVKVCTMHSSKGLEFDAVLIPRFNMSSVPPDHLIGDADEEDEIEILKTERALLYVAMTRAKDLLAFTYNGFPSPFLAEFEHSTYEHLDTSGKRIEKPDFEGITADQLIGRKDQEKANRQQNKPSSTNRPSTERRNITENNKTTDEKKPEIKLRPAGNKDIIAGKHVVHKTFGPGVITEVHNALLSSTVTINFENAGQKKLATSVIIKQKMLSIEE